MSARRLESCAHIFLKRGDLDFETGVTVFMLLAPFSTLKHVDLCERCTLAPLASGSQGSI